jgi:hypothetical protein
MSVKLPSKFDFDVDMGIDGNIDANIDLTLPTEYGISIHELPTINFNIAPIEIRPLEMSFRLKEVPSIRAHFPLDYKVCFGFLGIEIASVHFCGQAQVITEPYVPNPCELRFARLVRDDQPAPEPNPGNIPH